MREKYLIDVAKNFRNLQHQVEALNYLQTKIEAAAPGLLEDFAKRYSPAQKPVTPQAGEVLHKAKYFYQQDSATSQSARMCQSSSCAMLLEWEKPNTLAGTNGDDKYLSTVLKYGDTTDGNAHTKALAQYGLKTAFVQNCTWAKLVATVKAGNVVPVGVLHHGPATAPVGGGHWICVVGIQANDAGIICHDPYGRLNWASGVWMDTSANAGMFNRISKTNFMNRWCVEGDGSGWAHLVA